MPTASGRHRPRTTRATFSNLSCCPPPIGRLLALLVALLLRADAPFPARQQCAVRRGVMGGKGGAGAPR